MRKRIVSVEITDLKPVMWNGTSKILLETTNPKQDIVISPDSLQLIVEKVVEAAGEKSKIIDTSQG